MSGVYIHIPYCSTRCIYCDFFTQVDMRQCTMYVKSVCDEAVLRKGFIGDELVQTIYFGGGTPSQLNEKELSDILDALLCTFNVSPLAEITIEVNPDDLNDDYIAMLRSLRFNRISMGIQSFDDDILKFLRRRHDASKAKASVAQLQEHGFDNISIDLIYGIPGQTQEMWNSDLEEAMKLNIQHVSAYHLIYEEETPLSRLLEKREINPIDEDLSLAFLERLIDVLHDNGFVHYEISNFAKSGFYSKHNTSYWDGRKYLGLGTAAHSYNGKVRSYNISSIQKYIEGISAGEGYYEIETLDERTLYNEYILTRMRTMWGIDMGYIKNRFGDNRYLYCAKFMQPYLDGGFLKKQNEIVSLTRNGIFISDKIMSDLMLV